MNQGFNQRSVWYLFATVILLVLSCQSNDPPQVSRTANGGYENRFFTFDFKNNTYELSQLEDQFFTTFPHDDPTQGSVIYDRRKWVNQDMIEMINGDGLYLYIKSRADMQNFDSFRLTSKAFYNLHDKEKRILFVFKGKFPSGKGIWPAWWLNGSKQDQWTYANAGPMETDSSLDRFSGKGHFYDTPSAVNSTDWPAAGEIDIIETINGENLIHNTIHTCPQMCDSEWNNDGNVINCANATADDPNSGCSGKPYQVDSVEGTFACLWGSRIIKFYYWPPQENTGKDGGPLSKRPNPDNWQGEYLKNEVRLLETNSECDDETHMEWQCKNCESSNACEFTNMKIIFNITICGVWAGSHFDSTRQSMDNCQTYISGPGKDQINNQFIKIEYLSVSEVAQ